MSGQPYVRPDGPLTDLSASRIRTVDKCSLAFRFTYVDKIPAASESASALFGNIVHDGTDIWYGPPEKAGQHKDKDLAPVFHELWSKYLPPTIWAATERCIAAADILDRVAEAIKLGRPELKNPRQTKAYMECPEAKAYADLLDNLTAKCDKLEDIRWPKDENPVAAYRKSMVIAQQLQARWQPLPRPLVVEHPFLLKFAGFNVKGRIDQIRIDPDEHGEPGPVGLLDIKAGRQALSQMEAFIQAFLYWRACEESPELPTPDDVWFWLARHDRGQRGQINMEKHAKLAEKILNRVGRTIITADWTPSYGMWCKSCDFKTICEEELGLWPVGEETMALVEAA